MSSAKETVTITLGVVASILIVFGFFAVVCLRVSTNDHAKIERDRAIKVACIRAGLQLVSDNCLPIK